jgi:hypothetical protein
MSASGSYIRTGSFWHATIGQQIESAKSAAVFVGASGVGPWQSREIIAVLDEFDKRDAPLFRQFCRPIHLNQ